MNSPTKTAFIFPGQGSQKIGMLSAFEDNLIVQDTFAEASHILFLNLWQIAHRGPAEIINSTEITQPLLLTASIALWRLYQQQHPDAPIDCLAGHSLGEYSALVASGALTFSDAVKLVHQRGLFMQAAAKQHPNNGAMAAILGLERDAVEAVCQHAKEDGILSAVNYNSPLQTVIAGDESAVQRACEHAKEKGAKRAITLAVSVPSHCAIMQPAAEQLAEVLADTTIVTPNIPVIHNVNASVISNPEAIKESLVAQLHSPVRWVESMEKLIANNCQQFIECGPNTVLTGLGKRIAKTVQWTAIEKLVTP